MTNIETLALDIVRSDNPEKVLKALLVVLDMIWSDKPVSGAQNDMGKALEAIEAVVPTMLEEAKEGEA